MLKSLKVTVTCPDCQESRTINKASTQCGNFTGVCMKCARARAYARKHPVLEPEPDVLVKKQFCLKCDVQIPYNPALRLCETCRATNARSDEGETYGTPIKVKVGYSIW